MATKKVVVEPLNESALKTAIEKMHDLDAEYAALDKRYDLLAAGVLATMKPKDVRQYGMLRCTIVQAIRRTVDWKGEASRLARKLFPAPEALRAFVRELAKRYPRKPIKASIKISVLKGDA